MAFHNQVGNWGEQIARDYLVSRGYAIVAQNERIGNIEIDIIAMKDDRIIFVEVKTRSTHFVDPLEAIDQRKMARLAKAADLYVRSMEIPHDPQIDLIAVIGAKDAPRDTITVEHIPDAFLPPLGGALAPARSKLDN